MMAWAAGVGVVLWLPPVADQIRQRAGQHPPARSTTSAHRPSRHRRRRGCRAGPAPPRRLVGPGPAGHRHRPVRRRPRRRRRRPCWSSGSSPPRSPLALGPPRCDRCTSSSPSGPVLGTASMARIFGRPWYYLTLWAWGTTTVLVGAVLWTGADLVAAPPPRSGSEGRRRSSATAVAGRRARRRRPRWPRRSPSPTPTTPRSD